jgi:signal transduction histidine kinase
LLAPERSIVLELTPDVSAPIMADAARINQVLTNYLSNALKFAPPDRPIVVGMQAGPCAARVTVRDEGPGIPMHERERIWERFYQIAAGCTSKSASAGGLGLGLFICRSLIEAHGGQVGVESEPGQGATFWFTLPRAVPS